MAGPPLWASHSGPMPEEQAAPNQPPHWWTMSTNGDVQYGKIKKEKKNPTTHTNKKPKKYYPAQNIISAKTKKP